MILYFQDVQKDGLSENTPPVTPKNSTKTEKLQQTPVSLIGDYSKVSTFLWWLYDTEALSMVLSLCKKDPPMACGFPSQRPAMQSFNVFYFVNWKQLLNQWRWVYVTVMPFHSSPSLNTSFIS